MKALATLLGHLMLNWARQFAVSETLERVRNEKKPSKLVWMLERQNSRLWENDDGYSKSAFECYCCFRVGRICG